MARIAFLIRSLDLGGAEGQLAILAKGLSAKGFDVAVLTYYPGGPLERDLSDTCVRLHNLEKRGRWDMPGFMARLARLLRDVEPDGSIRLDLSYFNYCTGLTMTNERFDKLFGGPPRKPDLLVTQRDMDLAASIQAVLKEAVLRMTRALAGETGCATCASPAASRSTASPTASATRNIRNI